MRTAKDRLGSECFADVRLTQEAWEEAERLCREEAERNLRKNVARAVMTSLLAAPAPGRDGQTVPGEETDGGAPGLKESGVTREEHSQEISE